MEHAALYCVSWSGYGLLHPTEDALPAVHRLSLLSPWRGQAPAGFAVARRSACGGGEGRAGISPFPFFFSALSPGLRGKGQASPGHIRQLVLEVIRGDAREHTLYDIARYASGNDVIQGEVLIKVA